MLTKYAECTVLDVTAVPTNASSRRVHRLRRQAHRHSFDYEPRRGFVYVRSRAISSRCNDNFDEFPAEEIKKAYRTFVGKPVFVNHHNDDHRRSRGVIIDAALHEDTNPDGSPDTWVEVLMEVDAVNFPMLAKALVKREIERTSMGTDVAYSICTACGNKAENPAQYCRHIPAMKGMRIKRHNATTGKAESVLVAERCYGLGFFENSLLVEPPADPTAYAYGIDTRGIDGLEQFAGLKATASRTAAPAHGSRSNHEALADLTDEEIEEAEILLSQAAKDPTVPPSEHGDSRLQGVGVSVSKDDQGFYVHTHRARSKSYESVAKIPDSEIKRIEATGATEQKRCMSCKGFGWIPGPKGERRITCTVCNGSGFVDKKRGARKVAGWYSEDEEVHTYEHEGVGEGVVSMELAGNPLDHTGRWEWEAYTYDSLPAREKGMATTLEDAMAAVEQVVAGGQMTLGSRHQAISEFDEIAQAYQPRPDIKSGDQPPVVECPECGEEAAYQGMFMAWPFGQQVEYRCSNWHTHNRRPVTKGEAHTSAAIYGPVVNQNLGRCYELAAKRVCFGPNDSSPLLGYRGAHLVHGTIQGFNNPSLGHAWVIEPNGDIWEPATDTVYDALDFEELFNPVGLVSYTVEEARRMASRSKHFGPWHEEYAMASRHTAAVPEGYIPEGYVFCKFESHRARDNFQRAAERAGGQVIPLVSFTRPHIYAVPKDVLDEVMASSGNAKRGVTPLKRTPDLSEYRAPIGRSSSHYLAYGEQRAPDQVDTMREEKCPVCGDEEAFTGEKCGVCGYIAPPKKFQDPDLDRAKQVDLRAEQTGDTEVAPDGEPGQVGESGGEAAEPSPSGQTLKCDNCGETFDSGGEDEQQDDQKAQVPDQRPDADRPPVEPTARQPRQTQDPALDGDSVPPKALQQPEDEPVEDEEQPSEGGTCPKCGEGTLHAEEQPEKDPAAAKDEQEESSEEDDDEDSNKPPWLRKKKPPQKASATRRKWSRDMPNQAQQQRSRILEALGQQQQMIQRVARHNAVLHRAVVDLATAAGVQNHPRFAALIRTGADEEGDEVAKTDQQALAPAAKDDPESIGASPAPANTGVTPDATTDVQNGNVAETAEPFNRLEDVQAQEPNTDSPPKGDAAHVETEIQVGTPSTDVANSFADGGWKNTSSQDPQARFMASLRLARLRRTAGVDTKDELVLGQEIMDSQASMGDIEVETATLERVVSNSQQRQQAQPQQRQARRGLVPQAAQRSRPSLAQSTASASGPSDPTAPSPDEFLF